MAEQGIVLLIENNKETLDIKRGILEKEGLIVLAASTLSEARECVRQAVPDIAILDTMPSDESGLDFLRLLAAAKAKSKGKPDGLSDGANNGAADASPFSALNKKELAIAELAAQGLGNKEIAGEVCLSESRVKTTLTCIYRKLGLSDQKGKRKKMIDAYSDAFSAT